MLNPLDVKLTNGPIITQIQFNITEILKIIEFTNLTLVVHNHPQPEVLKYSVKPSLVGLSEDSRTTNFRPGLLVLIVIKIPSSRHLWIYLKD